MVAKTKPKPLFFFVFLLFLAILLIGMGASWVYLSGPVDRNSQEDIEVEIASGTTSSGIGSILKEKRLIHSEFLFKVYLKLNRVHSLKAGTYLFQQSMSLNEIVQLLENGSSYN